MNRKTIGLILIGLAAFALAGSGVGKFFAEQEPGMSDFMFSKLPYLAVIEILTVVAIAVPKTRLLGIILAASYFGGIIAFQWLIEEQAFPIIGVILNTILYAGAALYYPTLTDGTTGVASK